MAEAARQMLSFEQRHAIQPPSLTHAHELRASVGSKRRAATKASSPAAPKRGSSARERFERAAALEEALEDALKSPGTRGSPNASARRKARRSPKKCGGKGPRSLVALDDTGGKGDLSELSENAKAAAESAATGGGAIAESLAKAVAALDAADDELGLDAKTFEEERRNVLTPMTPGQHARNKAVAEVEEDPFPGSVPGDEVEVPENKNSLSLFGVVHHGGQGGLLEAVASGGAGYERPNTAQIIGDDEDLPPLTDDDIAGPEQPTTEGIFQTSGRMAREAQHSVCPQDFMDTASEDGGGSYADEDATPKRETRGERRRRERIAGAKQMARAPSRGQKIHSEALPATNFGPTRNGDLTAQSESWSNERKLWWQDAVTSEEVPETNMDQWKGSEAAAGKEMFFGTKARQAFFDLTKSQQREWNAEGMPDADGEGGRGGMPDSGRRHYLRECELTHTIPQALLVASGNRASRVVDLSHRRLGNTTGVAYAGALLKAASQQGVAVEELRLRENNLTTRGLMAMAATILSCKMLRVLDVSMNKFSEQGSEALAKALEHHPMIQQVTMSNCSIEDKDGAYLIEALSQNSSITYIDLSRNQLGAGARALHPQTSAAAKLAKMLEDDTPARINTLNLSYNCLSSAHFQLMASSLRSNSTLQRLDLSWNTCANNGAMALAEALRPNKALLLLDLTHTDIGERGAMVIADVLKENAGLELVKLNENPIGQRGGRAILRALRKILQYGWHTEITVARSNFSLVDESQKGTTRWKEADDPTDTGEHGAKRQILMFDRNQPLFDPANAGGFHKCNLADPYDRMVAWELVDLAWAEEGENWSDEKVDGGVFELDEPGLGEIWTRTEHPVLPDVGELSLKYQNTPRVPRFKDVLEPAMLIRLLEMMTAKEVTDNGVGLLRLAACEFWFTAQYVGLFLKMQKDSETRVMAVSALYPRIVDMANVQYHCLDYLTRGEMRKLESHLGILLHFVPSNPTGHYKLDLVNPMHRIIKQKLVGIAKEEKDFRRLNIANTGGSLIDTSQHGDWENFRNETLNKEKYDFDTSTAAAGGVEEGILEFDYVSTSVAHRLLNLPPMTEAVFELFLLDMFRVRHHVDTVSNLDKEGKAAEKAKKRAEAEAAAAESGDPLGATVGSMNDTQTSGFLAQSVSDLNETQELEFTKDVHGAGPESEETGSSLKIHGERRSWKQSKAEKAALDLDSLLLVFGDAATSSVLMIQCLWRGQMVRRVAAAKRKAADALNAKQLELEQLAQSSQHARPAERAGTGSMGRHKGQDVFEVVDRIISQGQKRPLKRKIRNCWWIAMQHHNTIEATKSERLHTIAKRQPPYHITPGLHTIAKRQLTMLRRCTTQWYFSVAQCTQILEAIPEASHVEAICIMFSRITDIETLDAGSLLHHQTFDKDGNGWITEDELAELKSEESPDKNTHRYLNLLHRIGWANLFNPLFPEREYALNLKDFAETPPSDGHPHGDRKGHHDARRVAECIIVLSAEPGDNTVNETYNGNPFEVENHWTDGVPHQGMFCTTYKTRKHGGALMLRLPLCRALLAPGKGRYLQAVTPCPLNARALEGIGNDEGLRKRYDACASAADPKEELINLIVETEKNDGGCSEQRRALRGVLSVSDFPSISPPFLLHVYSILLHFTPLLL